MNVTRFAQIAANRPFTTEFVHAIRIISQKKGLREQHDEYRRKFANNGESENAFRLQQPL